MPFAVCASSSVNGPSPPVKAARGIPAWPSIRSHTILWMTGGSTVGSEFARTGDRSDKCKPRSLSPPPRDSRIDSGTHEHTSDEA
eukprot:3437319-Pleurochrysis_carterae.AAC.1